MLHVLYGKIKGKYGLADVLFYTAAIVFAIAVKIYYRQMESFPASPGLILFLKPLSVIIRLFFGIPFDFDAEKGFFNDYNGIVIGSSCAGINFFLIVFCMLVFTFIRLFRTISRKAAAFSAFIAASYVFSLLANASRMIASISILGLQLLPAGINAGLLHELTGILFYLVYLICGFYISKTILSKVGSTYEASA